MFKQNSFIHRIPPITLNLIIINTLVWLAELVLGRFGIDIINMLGMHYYEASGFHIWQLITYAFLHDSSSIGHLFFNMFALFMFGIAIERTWGGKRYLIFYLVCALTAAISQQVVWFSQYHDVLQYASVSFPNGSTLPSEIFLNGLNTIGASGAVFGILLAFGMLFPNMPLYIFFIPIPVKAKYFVIVYGLLELWAGINPGSDGIAHFAHIGGMIGGFLLILWWRRTGKISKHSLY